jgi:hypothetical protein
MARQRNARARSEQRLARLRKIEALEAERVRVEAVIASGRFAAADLEVLTRAR